MKAPLHPSTFQQQKQRMFEIGSRLMTLRLPSGRLAFEDGRRMSVISLAFTLKSVAELAGQLFNKNMCRCEIAATYTDLYVGIQHLDQNVIAVSDQER